MERYYTGPFEGPPTIKPPARPEDIYVGRAVLGLVEIYYFNDVGVAELMPFRKADRSSSDRSSSIGGCGHLSPPPDLVGAGGCARAGRPTRQPTRRSALLFWTGRSALPLCEAIVDETGGLGTHFAARGSNHLSDKGPSLGALVNHRSDKGPSLGGLVGKPLAVRAV